MTLRRGRSGDDILSGTMQRDALSGANGDDRLYGRDGNDGMAGGLGNDFLSGGNGRDVLHGDAGNDRLYGGQGNDLLDGGTDRDALYGGDGRDRLLGLSGNDRLFGEHGSDVLDGGAGRDELRGGSGADRLLYDGQDSVVDGGAGRDTLVLAGSGMNLDLGHLEGLKLGGIEVIDLNGTGDNTLRLGASDVLAIDSQHTLLVMGGAGDSVISPLDVWTQNAAGAIDIGGQHYLAWDAGNAHLLVDADISLNNLTPGGTTFAGAQNASFQSFHGSLADWVADVPLDSDLNLKDLPPV